MQIPVSFRGSGQSQQGQQQGGFSQQGGQGFGGFQGGQHFGYGGQQQQPSFGGKESFTGKEYFTGGQQGLQSEQGFQSQQGMQQQGQGMQQQMTGKNIGQWVQKEIQSTEVSTSDLTHIHALLLISGECYIKEHVLMKLCPDSTGVLKSWHHNVTIKNLDALCQLSKSWGLTLPFHKTPEQREQEIKSKLPNVIPIFTDGEALKELKLGACLLEQHFAQAFFMSYNDQLKDVIKNLCGNLCDNVVHVKNALTNTQEFYPVPFVKTIVCKEGVPDRK